MSDNFSPYRDWLGLGEFSTRPDHYQLLGLPPFEADPSAVRAAAERSLGRLRAISPSGHDREWMQLMRELLEAEDTLNDAGKKAAYDSRLRGHDSPPPTQPGYGAAMQHYAPYPPQPAYPPAAPWQAGPNPMAPAPNPMAPMGYGAPMPPQYAAPPPAGPYAAAYPPPAYPNYYQPPGFAPPPPPPPPMSQVPDPMAPLSFGAPAESPFAPPAAPSPGRDFGVNFAPQIGPQVAIPTGVALAPEPPAEPELPADRRWKRNEDEPPAEAAAPQPAPVIAKPKKLDLESEADLSEKNLQKMLIPLGGVAAAALLVIVVLNSTVNRPRRDIAQNQPATTPVVNPAPTTPVPPVNTPSVAEPKKETPKAETPPEETPEPSKPEPPRRKPKPKPQPEEAPAEEMPAEPTKPVAEPKPEPIKPTTPAPEPMPQPVPEPMPSPSEEMPKAEDVIKLAKGLREARVLVRESNAEEALKILKGLESLPMAPAHRAKWDRLYFLADSVRQCIEALQRTVPRLEAGSTITVGNTVISIVEGDMQKIIVRINGQNRTYSLNELPVGLGIALADMSLDRKEAVNLVVKGAYVIARSSDDAQIAKARAWWQEAITRGISECERLVPVIEDTYDLEKELPKN